MLEISLPSGVEYLPLVDSLCHAFCVWTGVPDDVSEEISIAVVEATTNAVVHGNRCDKHLKVRLVFKKSPDEVEIAVADRGAGFNPDDVPNPTDNCNLLKESGRGIYIMRQVMDDVQFAFPKGGGTTVRMVKRLKHSARGRVLCIDFGSERLGLALSDETALIAQPFGLIEVGKSDDPIEEVRAVCAENGVCEIVIGMPITLAGKTSESASRVTAFARQLNQRSGLPVVTWDERLSTKQSERMLVESGMRRDKRKGKIDAVAASVILQSYLDAKRIGK